MIIEKETKREDNIHSETLYSYSTSHKIIKTLCTNLNTPLTSKLRSLNAYRYEKNILDNSIIDHERTQNGDPTPARKNRESTSILNHQNKKRS